MKLSTKFKFRLFLCLLALNVILRIQVLPREIGWDSFEMHIMVNSLSEFGYAKWFLHPLSVVGIYPASYSSSMQFLLSGLFQTSGMEMDLIIFVYSIFLGVLSIFVIYLMAGAFINNDLFKLLAAIIFSTLNAVLTYTTWTIPTRGLFLILAPIAIYLLLEIISKKNIKYVLLLILFSSFLFSIHHLFYFLLPLYVSVFIIVVFSKRLEKIKLLSENLIPFLLLLGFILMFSVPFFTGKFVENSRYSAVYISYMRYLGLSTFFAIGGFFYLVFKNNKNKLEYFVIISSIFLTVFIYEETYFKWFIPLIAIVFACVGLLNVINQNQFQNKKIIVPFILIVFMLASTGISGYYQFLHDYGGSRYIDESTYYTGKWLKYAVSDSCISNDVMLGRRMFSISETTHFLESSTTLNQIYGFNKIDISKYEMFSVLSDDFWMSGYKGPDVGEATWYAAHKLWQSPLDLNISYMVENTNAHGRIWWGHGPEESKLLQEAYKNNKLYDTGNINIWTL